MLILEMSVMAAMTKLLDQAISNIRELPEADQDDVAELLFNLAARANGQIQLDDETRTAVREGRAQARRGEFATEEEIAAVFKQARRGA
jgi:predicted transcriptional regulator